MKYIFKIILFYFILNFTQFSYAQSFMIGASKRNINPDKDTLYMAGGKPNRPFIDIHDSLFVKCIYVSNQEKHVIILTYDCIGLMNPALLEIRKRVKIQIPQIDPENIVISSTHTHAGPDVVGIWGKNFSQSGVNKLHMEKIISSSIETIKESIAKKSLCTMQYAEGKFGEDWVKNISEPFETDRAISTIRFINDQNMSIATLTNFACHPTIMDDATNAASADFVWGYYHYLDSIQGGINMFIQGAIGGWVQPENIQSSFDNALYYGSSIGKYVYNILSNGKKNISNNILFKSTQVKFPMKNKNFSMLSKAGVIPRQFGEYVTSEIAYFKIGDIQFATHPGESSPAMSIATRSLMNSNYPTFIMGLSQDALGYILKPSFFVKEHHIPHSEYLTSMSIGPETMKIIMDQLKLLIQH